jgi:hypothetical protein
MSSFAMSSFAMSSFAMSSFAMSSFNANRLKNYGRHPQEQRPRIIQS